MKHFLKFLMMACVMFVVDPGEGGGGTDSSDSTDGDLGSGGSADQIPASTGGEQSTTSDTVNIPKEMFDKIASSVEHMENMHAVNAAVTGIKAEIPDFDLGKVHAKLEEMHKTDPDGAKALNHPAGWKMLWKSEIAEGDVEVDGVNGGRKTSGDNRRDLVGRIRSGEADAGERASLLLKYL